MIRETQNKNHLDQHGFCVWLTGLSGSGKSTIAEGLRSTLSITHDDVVLLDGDVLRKEQNKDLGFSRKDRIENILRVGKMATEIVRRDGIAIASLISPYEDARNRVQSLFDANQFTLVHVSTPLAICEERDTKGLYKKARLGEIKNFTGITDPYESPISPDIEIDTSIIPVERAISLILEHTTKF